ncbi:unnamed protein product, partial [Vitis vinifera]
MPPEDYYDYIVVGGGTAGCPLAATLSENFRVLVLERGGVPYTNPNLMSQDGFLTSLMEADPYDSPAQTFTSEDGVANARGRVLGGSSAINAGFYSRADEDFYKKSGLKWDLHIVNQSYEWVERAVVFRPELKNWQSAVRDGLLEAGVDPYRGFILDHAVGTKIGGSTFDSSGRRHTAADLLGYAKATNIRVAVHASVERILLAPTSALFVGPALPVNQSNDAQMAEFCHRTVSTIWHYHGGCIVGKVVDSDHQVLGIDALRVVDGSTFNVSPGTNPQATLMMLGRYIGIKITKERMR